MQGRQNAAPFFAKTARFYIRNNRGKRIWYKILCTRLNFTIMFIPFIFFIIVVIIIVAYMAVNAKKKDKGNKPGQ